MESNGIIYEKIESGKEESLKKSTGPNFESPCKSEINDVVGEEGKE